MPVGEGAKRRTGLVFSVMIRHPFSKRFRVRLALNPVWLWSRLRGLAIAERHRWPLWLPVALGGGCALYCAWPDEPSIGFNCAVAVLALAAGLASPRWPVLALAAALGL